MKKILLMFVVFIMLGFLSINRRLEEFDEGIYLNTFLSVKRGFPLYKSTFFSQLPGFYILTYPGFILFGETLIAARLTIFIWSIIGLAGILWLSYELGNVFIGLFTICFLYLIPQYINQTITFQADLLALVFSILAIASILRFYNTNKIKWVILSSIFSSIALLTKFDPSPIVIFVLIFIFSKVKYNIPFFKSMRLIAVYLISLFLTASLVFSPFNIKSFFDNVVDLRLLAFSHFPLAPQRLLFYLFQNRIFLLIIIGSIILGLKYIKELYLNKIFLILFCWSFFNFFLMELYRPLMIHQLVLLMGPFSFLFSFLLLYHYRKIDKRVLSMRLNLLLFLVFILNIFILLSSQQGILDNTQKKIIKIIKENTNINDYIIGDDGLVSAFSGRKTPPELVDVSDIRIQTGNLSSKLFSQYLDIYKPKLIIVLTGRLKKIKGFEQIISRYKLLKTVDNKGKVYIYHVL